MPRSTSSLTALGCVSRIRERERAAPRAAEHEPAIDAETAAQPLHVRDEMPGGVGLERGMRAAASRAALIEHDDAVALRIEEAPRVDVAAGAGTAVHEQRGLPRGIARLLVVDVVAVAHGEIAGIERLDRRVLRALLMIIAVLVSRRCPAYTHSTGSIAHGPSMKKSFAAACLAVGLSTAAEAQDSGNPIRRVLSRQRLARHRA